MWHCFSLFSVLSCKGKHFFFFLTQTVFKGCLQSVLMCFNRWFIRSLGLFVRYQDKHLQRNLPLPVSTHSGNQRVLNKLSILHLQNKKPNMYSFLVIITIERCKIFPVSQLWRNCYRSPSWWDHCYGYALQYMSNFVDNLDKKILRGCRLR